jgi:hypothetical protein
MNAQLKFLKVLCRSILDLQYRKESDVSSALARQGQTNGSSASAPNAKRPLVLNSGLPSPFNTVINLSMVPKSLTTTARKRDPAWILMKWPIWPDTLKHKEITIKTFYGIKLKSHRGTRAQHLCKS